MRHPRKLLSVLVGLIVLVAPAPPGVAQGSTGEFGTLTMPDTAIANGSKCASATVSFTSNGQLEDWEVRLESDAPYSTGGSRVVLTEAAPAKVLTFCTDRHRLGTYTFTGHLGGHLIGQNSYPSAYYSAKIRFGVAQRAPSTLAATVVRSHAKGSCPQRRTAHCSKLTGNLRSAGKPIAFATVEIQAYTRGAWRRQTAARTDRSGRVGWYVTINQSARNTRFRLYFPGNGLSKYVVSRSFKFKY